MNNLNSVMLEGNLVTDPTFSITEKGTELCTFTIACNHYYRDKETEEIKTVVDYFPVTTWSNLAINCSEYLHKGRGVRLTGKLKQDRWIDTEGKNMSRLKVVASTVDFKPYFSSPKS